MNPDIFKAYDIRGKVGTELNYDTAERVGKALADWLPTDGAVAVGFDMRPDSKELAEGVIEGLRLQGRKVINIGLVATDMIYFAVGNMGLAGGAMVTASHNPGEYNGIKLCRESARPIGLESGLDHIRDAALANNFVPAAEQAEVVTADVIDSWIQHVLKFVDTSKMTPLKIAVDAGNGMAGAIFPALEPFVPWDVTRMYFELDGSFPNHPANPMLFETLEDLIATIRESGLDAGVAFDGDGDRAFLVDETGQVVTGGVMTAILADYFLDKYPDSHIIYDARNSKVVPDTIQKKGGTAVRTKVGHASIKQVMRDKDAPFGGEASGHFYFRDNWYADSGLIAAVIALYVLSLSGKKLSELREQYSYYATMPETNFTVEDKKGVIERLAREFEDGEHDTLDGLTVTYENGWLNVRASNTEPLMRLNAEANDPDALERIIERATRAITA